MSAWNRVFGSLVFRSPGQRFLPGRVGSQVSVTDLVSYPVFVVFARALLLLLGGEYDTLESVGFCVFSNFTSWSVCVLHRPETFGRKQHIVVKIISQFKAQTLGDRVGSPGQKRPGRLGSGHGSKVQTRFHLWCMCCTSDRRGLVHHHHHFLAHGTAHEKLNVCEMGWRSQCGTESNPEKENLSQQTVVRSAQSSVRLKQAKE